MNNDNNIEGAIRLGIIGTGRIAARFAGSVDKMPGIVPVAVFNVNPISAERFAKEHGIPKHTEDLCSFMNEVDAVYIASPHETHGDYARIALEYGKHVLCEKPMSLNREEAEKLFYLADKKNLVLMEAIKTAYCEGFIEMMKEVDNGTIGVIHDVEAAFTKLADKDTRELTDTKHGGSFLEYGSYTLLPIFRLFGTNYNEVRFQSVYADNGLDIYTKAIFDFGNEEYATAKCGLGVKSEGQILISGTSGYILGEAPWWLTSHYEVRHEDPNHIDGHTFAFDGSGLQYEGAEFAARIRGEVRENLKRDERESIARAAVMEQFLRENRGKRRKNKGTDREIDTDG